MKLPAAGLFTNPGALGDEVPAGALSRARNVVLDRPSVATPRPGQAPGADALGTPLLHLAEHAGSLYGASASALWRLEADAWGGEAPFAFAGLPGSAEVGGLLVLPGADGVRTLEAGALRAAGVPRALDFFRAIVGATAGGWLPAGASVAFRASLARKDATGRVLRGAPSGRAVYVNTTADARAPSLFLSLPREATTEMFVEVWRTGAQPSGADPGDAMQKVGEFAVTPYMLTTGDFLAQWKDTAPDAYRGEVAYFNAAQDGLAGMRLEPPLARVVGAFRDMALYGDATERHALRLRLLALPQDGDVLVLGGVRYYFKAGLQADQEGVVYLETSGALSLSRQIELTARALVDAINNYDGETQRYARYDSGPTDPPGILTIETRSLATPGFSVHASRGGDAFLPALPLNVRAKSRARAGGVVTCTAEDAAVYGGATAHGLAVGDVVTGEAAGAFGAGPFALTATTATTFSYAEAGADGASATPAVFTRTQDVPAASSSAISRPGRTYYSLKDLPGAVGLAAYVEAGDATKAILAYAALRDTAFAFKEDGLFRLVPLSGGTFTWEPFNDTLRLLAPRSVAVLENRIYALTNKGIVSVSEAGVDEVSLPFSPTLDALLAQSDAETLAARAFGLAHEKDGRYLLWLPTAPGASDAGHAFVYTLSTETWTERDDGATCGLVGEDAHLRLGGADGAVSRQRRTGTLADFQDADGAPLEVDVAWVPDASGGAGAKKQYSEVAAVFEHDVPAARDFTFTFEGDDGLLREEDVPSEGGPYVLAEVPPDVQRSTRLGLGVRRSVLAEDFRLAGLDVRVRLYTGKLKR